MRNTKNAFTLVELIVVITILAILGTIAFISLQGYSADARNSKRTSDVGNIQSAISLKSVEWVPLLSFISSTDNAIPSIAIWWNTGTTVTSAEYNAGKPNYTVLNVVQKDFIDPKSDQEYRIGATTLAGGVFQVAASMEADGDLKALVNGTYHARLAASTATGTADVTKFTLADKYANMFKVGDQVAITGWTTGVTTTVSKVSRDGVTLTLAADATDNTTVALAADETAGLIGDGNVDTTATWATAVTNDSLTALPY